MLLLVTPPLGALVFRFALFGAQKRAECREKEANQHSAPVRSSTEDFAEGIELLGIHRLTPTRARQSRRERRAADAV
jgi:hypothetical protein